MALIPLRGKYGKGKHMEVDDADYELLNRFSWHAYPDLSGVIRPQACLRPHDLLLPKIDGKVVDHKDGNPLNYRRQNLRHATHQQNMRNRKKSKGKPSFTNSRYKGVTMTRKGKWIATVAGTVSPEFDSEINAAKVYDVMAREAYGEFARTNF